MASSYSIDPDLSNSESDATPPSRSAAPMKRLRPPAPPRPPTSLSSIRLTLPSGVSQPSPRPSHNHSAHRAPSHRPHAHPRSHPNQRHHNHNPHPRHHHPPASIHQQPNRLRRNLPTQMQMSSARPLHQPPPVLQSADESLLQSAASILPDSSREIVLNESRNAANVRKRPSRRTTSLRSAVSEERDRKRLIQNAQAAQRYAKSDFQPLQQLFASTTPNLIPSSKRPQSSAPAPPKRRRLTGEEVYASVTMTKEMREREERDRLLEEQRSKEEQLAIIQHYRQKRVKERSRREMLRVKWKKVETVAAGMRDACRLDIVERRLFAEEADAHKKDSLQYLGFSLKPIGVDNHSTALLTVEMVEY